MTTDSAPFQGYIGETYRTSTPSWPKHDSAHGRPNVVFVVLDDLGYASLGCFGSEIDTPTIDRLATEGIRFANFHATALCSPTRASLLTGRNHHAVGMAYLSHVDDGYPGYRGHVDPRATMISEILVDAGYNTMAVGKWHLTPMDQTSAAGPYDQWPLGRGFERYYGFLEALTDHYYPELYYDQHAIDPPRSPEDGYHLTEDLVDKSIEFLRDQTSVAPDKPFFLYLALGATHTPFQAPPDLVGKYRGVYNAGWDAIRERRFQRQLAEGLIPSGTELPPPNDDVAPWESLSAEQRDLYVRYQEVYAAFLEHTDIHIGRLLEYLEHVNRLEDTVVVLLSDNGASQEGGPHGVTNTTAYENGHLTTLEHALQHKDDIDGRTTHVNYPLGWAQAANTPLRRYKQNTHAGGIRTPMIMRLPGAAHGGQQHESFQHVADIVPTVLDYLGLTAPTTRRGQTTLPIDGRSFRPRIETPELAEQDTTQYFETDGHRALFKNGWKAVAHHRQGTHFDDDQWELYHLAEDFSECSDLAASHPEKLSELVTTWWSEARKNHVLPLDDRGFAERANQTIKPHTPRARHRFVYYNGMQHLGNACAPPVPGRAVQISSTVTRETRRDNGVLFAHGSVNSGYCLLVDDGHLVYDLNYYGDHTLVRSEHQLPIGTSDVQMRFQPDTGPSCGGTVRLLVNGLECARSHLDETFPHFVAFQGLDVGADRLSPVRTNGVGAFPFTGGMDSVVVEFLDDPPLRGPHDPND